MFVTGSFEWKLLLLLATRGVMHPWCTLHMHHPLGCGWVVAAAVFLFVFVGHCIVVMIHHHCTLVLVTSVKTLLQCAKSHVCQKTLGVLYQPCSTTLHPCAAPPLCCHQCKRNALHSHIPLAHAPSDKLVTRPRCSLQLHVRHNGAPHQNWLAKPQLLGQVACAWVLGANDGGKQTGQEKPRYNAGGALLMYWVGVAGEGCECCYVLVCKCSF